MTEERMELRIGTPIIARDGAYGYLEQIVIDRPSSRVTGLVVRKNPLVDTAPVIPLEKIADATDEEIRVQLNCAQIARLPDFDATETLPEILHAGQTVRTTDGHTSHIVDLLITPSGNIHHLVVHTGILAGQNVILPVESVSQVKQLTVLLKSNQRELESLPSYRPDADILGDLESALWRDPVLRVLERHSMEPEVSDGIVILRGHVATTIAKMKASTIAATVPGVLKVCNLLTSDPDIQSLVAQTLGQEPCLRDEYPRVEVQHGVVILSGKVGSAQARRIAEECAASIPQVRGVLNYLRAPGIEHDERTLRVFQPRIGQEVFTADPLPLGRVIRVIVNPKNRLVVGMVVESMGDQTIVKPDEPITSREIILPASVIELVTVGGVFLSVSRQHTVWADAFDESDFDPPPADWTPPYPYFTGDIVFSRIER